ncbi:protein of unknown function DUF6 transmembrane [Thermobaculum terrenum ATCC BAA-798]|uniref:EamA domain-containing protein n=1 Tax=Thermobaculum terrenum (strain ATCC BAA-798 / CCMEE 7001 / YNP1) TaxID=525904 RepID=D1CFK2_THET1|nr:DMT family transporter [Thermobaculum terrenum]ACZ41708.1 protein of unknown function DUF6 transmembrane [Thermobaculum terrenum ATCC BAA-798]
MKQGTKDRTKQLSGIALAFVAVSMFSTSAVLIRVIKDISSIEITFWRMLIAGLLVLGAALISSQLSLKHNPFNYRFLAYGLVAAMHFFFYIASLEYTTVSNSLALVYTAPVFVALFAALALHESINWRQWLGICIVVVGVMIFSGFDLGLDKSRLIGNFLAILSAAAFGVYSVMGRGERNKYPLLVYAGGTYLTASLWLLPLAAHSMINSSYSMTNIIALLALAIVPLGMGHTLYNAALRRIHAAHANVLSTLEVPGGTLLAWLFVKEPVTLRDMIGMFIILFGVLTVILTADRTP